MVALTIALSALLVGLMIWMVISARRGSALRAETRVLREADRHARERLASASSAAEHQEPQI